MFGRLCGSVVQPIWLLWFWIHFFCSLLFVTLVANEIYDKCFCMHTNRKRLFLCNYKNAVGIFNPASQQKKKPTHILPHRLAVHRMQCRQQPHWAQAEKETATDLSVACYVCVFHTKYILICATLVGAHWSNNMSVACDDFESVDTLIYSAIKKSLSHGNNNKCNGLHPPIFRTAIRLKSV